MPATSIENGPLGATLRKIPLGDRKNAYMLLGGGKWFTVCNGIVYGYSFEMKGGYDEFVSAVEHEQQRRDRASMLFYSPKMEILTQWEDGQDDPGDRYRKRFDR